MGVDFRVRRLEVYFKERLKQHGRGDEIEEESCRRRREKRPFTRTTGLTGTCAE